MPTFGRSSRHQAIIRVTNTGAVTAQFWVKAVLHGSSDGSDIGLSSVFVLPPGAANEAAVALTMPGTPGNYMLDGEIHAGSAPGASDDIIAGTFIALGDTVSVQDPSQSTTTLPPPVISAQAVGVSWQ